VCHTIEQPIDKVARNIACRNPEIIFSASSVPLITILIQISAAESGEMLRHFAFHGTSIRECGPRENRALEFEEPAIAIRLTIFIKVVAYGSRDRVFW
jgi:hypothetical protein